MLNVFARDGNGMCVLGFLTLWFVHLVLWIGLQFDLELKFLLNWTEWDENILKIHCLYFSWTSLVLVRDCSLHWRDVTWEWKSEMGKKRWRRFPRRYKRKEKQSIFYRKFWSLSLAVRFGTSLYPLNTQSNLVHNLGESLKVRNT